jgi:hypothetical protein
MNLNSVSTKEKGFAETVTPTHGVRNNNTEKGGRTTFSQRIASRNSIKSSSNAVTPSANMESLSTPVTPASTKPTETETVVVNDSNVSVTVNDDPYESILQDAAKWKRELEGVRDEVFFLQVQNAIHLDYLTMAGAEE